MVGRPVKLDCRAGPEGRDLPLVAGFVHQLALAAKLHSLMGWSAPPNSRISRGGFRPRKDHNNLAQQVSIGRRLWHLYRRNIFHVVGIETGGRVIQKAKFRSDRLFSKTAQRLPCSRATSSGFVGGARRASTKGIGSKSIRAGNAAAGMKDHLDHTW